MTKSKSTTIFWLIFLPLIITSSFGCDLHNQEQKEDLGSVTISIHIPQSLLPPESSGNRSILEDANIHITQIEIAIDNGKEQHNLTINASELSEENSVTFNELALGLWSIQVDAIDNEGIIIATSTEQAEIVGNETTSKNIPLTLLSGELILQIVIPDDEEIQTGKVTLFGIVVADREEIFSAVGGDTVFLHLGELKPRIWNFEIEFFSDNHAQNPLLYRGSNYLTILPGRQLILEIVISSSGDLEISLSLDLPPERPKNITANRIGVGVALLWDPVDGASVYTILRSTKEDGQKTLLTKEGITTTKYVDTTVNENSTYWYWVVAYLEDGLSSGLSNPIMIELPNFLAGEHLRIVLPDETIYLTRETGLYGNGAIMGNPEHLTGFSLFSGNEDYDVGLDWFYNDGNIESGHIYQKEDGEIIMQHEVQFSNVMVSNNIVSGLFSGTTHEGNIIHGSFYYGLNNLYRYLQITGTLTDLPLPDGDYNLRLRLSDTEGYMNQPGTVINLIGGSAVFSFRNGGVPSREVESTWMFYIDDNWSHDIQTGAYYSQDFVFIYDGSCPFDFPYEVTGWQMK